MERHRKGMTFDTGIILRVEFFERSENKFINIRTCEIIREIIFRARNRYIGRRDFIAARQKYLSRIASKNVINSCSGHALI